MTKYRVTLDKEVVRYASRPFATDTYVWDNEATLVGDGDVIADALRALADKISPRRRTEEVSNEQVQGNLRQAGD